MTRIVALLVGLALLTEFSARASTARISTPNASGATCPMMAHRSPSEGPCIGVPCPCHNYPAGTAVPNDSRVALLRVVVPLETPAASWTPASTLESRCVVGFPTRLDHPPDEPL